MIIGAIFRQGIGSEELIGILADMLDVSRTDVRLIDDLLETDETAKVAITSLRELKGDFRQEIELGIEEGVLPGIASAEAELDFFKRLCRVIGKECLVSDEDVDPYTWILVLPNGETHHVEIEDHEDVNIITLREEYRHLLPSE